jgi:Acyl-CoA carboxylase epsilon subunit
MSTALAIPRTTPAPALQEPPASADPQPAARGPVRGPARGQASAAAAAGPEAAADAAPLFSVTRGNPTDEELAALTAVVLALQAGEPAAAPGVRRRTARRSELLRPFRPHGPGAWRHTFR